MVRRCGWGPRPVGFSGQIGTHFGHVRLGKPKFADPQEQRERAQNIPGLRASLAFPATSRQRRLCHHRQYPTFSARLALTKRRGPDIDLFDDDFERMAPLLDVRVSELFASSFDKPANAPGFSLNSFHGRQTSLSSLNPLLGRSIL
ncbi:BQ5605_C076g12941 [Microbotryum silenes-dioicae]|uniref:BQ5605_C051g12525 protein n=1 Tax=Microbotryum silenes-dioicae TaxID=796604 RepID=A0A2X0NIX3_9BASI|nr:BQ5605_C051g12525 [Microbotryum silenes-dioicae]SGZ34698.1 BQ5605_C076g12941 [Microbotryum silenes-dioicae]